LCRGRGLSNHTGNAHDLVNQIGVNPKKPYDKGDWKIPMKTLFHFPPALPSI